MVQYHRSINPKTGQKKHTRNNRRSNHTEEREGSILVSGVGRILGEGGRKKSDDAVVCDRLVLEPASLSL